MNASCPTCATCHDTDAGFIGVYAASCAQIPKAITGGTTKSFDVCSGFYDKPARNGGFKARTMCCACGGGCSYGLISDSKGCCCPAKEPNATDSTVTADPGEELPPWGTAVIGTSVLLFLLLLLLLWWCCRRRQRRRREKARDKAQTRIDAVALYQDGAGKDKSGASRRQLELLRLGSVNSVGSFHCNPSHSSSNNGSTRAPIKPWPSSAGGTGGGMYIDRKGGGLFKGGFAWTRSQVEVDAEAGKMTFYKEVAPSKNKTGAVLGAEGGAGGDSTFATLGGPVLKEVRMYGHTYGGGSLSHCIPGPNHALPASCPPVHMARTGSQRRTYSHTLGKLHGLACCLFPHMHIEVLLCRPRQHTPRAWGCPRGGASGGRVSHGPTFSLVDPLVVPGPEVPPPLLHPLLYPLLRYQCPPSSPANTRPHTHILNPIPTRLPTPIPYPIPILTHTSSPHILAPHPLSFRCCRLDRSTSQR